jgi:hypothetical protein
VVAMLFYAFRVNELNNDWELCKNMENFDEFFC